MTVGARGARPPARRAGDGRLTRAHNSKGAHSSVLTGRVTFLTLYLRLLPRATALRGPDRTRAHTAQTTQRFRERDAERRQRVPSERVSRGHQSPQTETRVFTCKETSLDLGQHTRSHTHLTLTIGTHQVHKHTPQNTSRTTLRHSAPRLRSITLYQVLPARGGSPRGSRPRGRSAWRAQERGSALVPPAGGPALVVHPLVLLVGHLGLLVGDPSLLKVVLDGELDG